MKRVPNPSQGRRFNAVHAPHMKPDDLISVPENHEEHLIACFPGVQAEIDQLKALDLPASFSTTPGHVTGMRLVQLGVPGICPHCGGFTENDNPDCKEHPKNSGGGVTLGEGFQCFGSAPCLL